MLNKQCLWITNTPVTAIFDLDTRENVLLRGIHMWNMKAMLHTIQKLWPMLTFFEDKQTEKQTGQKLYAPNPSMLGHKKEKMPSFSPF